MMTGKEFLISKNNFQQKVERCLSLEVKSLQEEREFGLPCGGNPRC